MNATMVEQRSDLLDDIMCLKDILKKVTAFEMKLLAELDVD